MHGKDKLLHRSSHSSRHDMPLTDELNRAQDDKAQTNKGKKKNLKNNKAFNKTDNNNNNNNNKNKMTSETQYLM